ncbi:MAG TPA: AtpZ/AtpI family protein [Elusimicrobiota bacterium]|nr:AtpZ/AtpI family protein [Elusimicrobiota bacterium]
MTPSSGWRHVFAGTRFAITIVVCIVGGIWVDQRRGTDPWGALIGALLGVSAAFYSLIKEFKDDTHGH